MEIAAAWEEYDRRRRQDCRALVESLEPWLLPGMDVESATDVWWGLFSHAGWSLDG